MSQPGLPPSGMPKPSGPPPAVLLYALCLVPITAFAGYVVTYGQDEEALERKLRAKYGNEINQVESKRDKMSEIYMTAIKNPGSNEEQERRLQQVLRGGKGEVKRHHAIDRKYYGTEEGLQLQKQTEEEMQQHQQEERKKMKKIKKKLKKQKKKKAEEGDEEDGETSSTDTESESEKDTTTTIDSTRKKKAAAAGAAFAAAVASSKVNKATADMALAGEQVVKPHQAKEKSGKKKKKKAKDSSSMDMSQIATLTAVAGAAALIGFIVGGGSRRQ